MKNLNPIREQSRNLNPIREQNRIVFVIWGLLTLALLAALVTFN